MGITNLYPNLPGNLVEFQDGGMQLRSSTTNTASSKSILIVGTAVDGPVNEPVAIDMATVANLYGSDVDANGIPNGSTLTKYAKQAYRCGFNDIRCMRVTGSVAKATIRKNVVSELENLNVTKALGTARGNLAKVYDLTTQEGPIHGEPRVLINGGPNTVNMIVWDSYGRTVSIAQNKVSAGAELSAAYRNKVLNIEEVNVTADKVGTVAEPFVIDLVGNYYVTDETVAKDKTDPTKDEYGYLYGDASTIEVTLNGTPLTLGDEFDCTVVNDNEATHVNPSVTIYADVAIDDAIVVKFPRYTVSAEVEENLVDDREVSQVFTLDHQPVSFSVLADNVKVDDAALTVATDSGVTTLKVDAKFVEIGAAMVCKYVYEEEVTTQESIDFASVYGGTVYNEGIVSISAITKDGVEGRLISLTKPAKKRYSVTEEVLVFSSFDYPTFGRLVEAIKAHPLNNVFMANTDYENATTGDLPVSTNIKFDGGTDGINPTNNEMFVALSGERDENGYLTKQGAYQVLENYNVDYIYVAGIYADSKVTVSESNFHYELALLCAVLTYRTKMTHGFIDMSPNTNTTLIGIQNYVAKCLAYDNTHLMKDDTGNTIVDEKGNPLDLGWYTSLVVGPEPVCTSDTLGTYYGSPALAYAALNATIKAQSAPTNKALPGVKGMRYKMSNKQLNDITGNRMVAFKLKSEGTSTATSIPYVVDGCTSGAVGSDYARFSTVKIVTEVVDQVREVADPFIGEPNTVEQRNALAALISKRLSYLKEQGVIQYYDFEISASIQQVLLGECTIALTLVAPQELRKITTVVALKTAA